jgi:hypothetical protein
MGEPLFEDERKSVEDRAVGAMRGAKHCNLLLGPPTVSKDARSEGENRVPLVERIPNKPWCEYANRNQKDEWCKPQRA